MYIYLRVETGRSKPAKDNFNGGPDTYKMSEDTLLHRKLSK